MSEKTTTRHFEWWGVPLTDIPKYAIPIIELDQLERLTLETFFKMFIMTPNIINDP